MSKNFYRIYLTTFLITIGFSILAGVFGLAAGDSKNKLAQEILKTKGIQTGPNEKISESLVLEDTYKKVTLKNVQGGITVRTSKDDKTHLLISGSWVPMKDKKPFGYRIKDQELDVKAGGDNEDFKINWTGVFSEEGLQTNPLQITLEIPVGWKGDLKIKTVNGDLKIEDVHATRVETTVVSGDTQINSAASFESLKSKTVSGNVQSEATVNDVEVQGVSGDVVLKLPSGKKWETEMKTVSGEIKNSLKQNTQGEAASLKIRTVSGDVTITEK